MIGYDYKRNDKFFLLLMLIDLQKQCLNGIRSLKGYKFSSEENMSDLKLLFSMLYDAAHKLLKTKIPYTTIFNFIILSTFCLVLLLGVIITGSLM